MHARGTEQGYRSRAAFKLLQLDARFRFLPTARSVLDLCAAPGGWVLVAVNHAPVGAFVIRVDLVPIRPIRGAHSLTEDITTTKCRAAVRRCGAPLSLDLSCLEKVQLMHSGVGRELL
ncbi:uncharacterized protein [Miscanthus floridulus]|uniref:uncharacterized protein n=1 Tax=Miscanthus floridulus TaxID=154761 RepID=UPI00345A669A